MSSPTKLDSIVTQNPILRQLFRQAAAHHDISLRVKTMLEDPLRSHIQLATVRDGTLVLAVDSSAWAAKLRYQVPDLHKQMAKHPEFARIQTIRVKVAKSSPIDQPLKSRKARPMSESAADGVRRQAESLDDPALRTALLRLADRQKS